MVEWISAIASVVAAAVAVASWYEARSANLGVKTILNGPMVFTGSGGGGGGASAGGIGGAGGSGGGVHLGG